MIKSGSSLSREISANMILNLTIYGFTSFLSKPLFLTIWPKGSHNSFSLSFFTILETIYFMYFSLEFLSQLITSCSNQSRGPSHHLTPNLKIFSKFPKYFSNSGTLFNIANINARSSTVP